MVLLSSPSNITSQVLYAPGKKLERERRNIIHSSSWEKRYKFQRKVQERQKFQHKQNLFSPFLLCLSMSNNISGDFESFSSGKSCGEEGLDEIQQLLQPSITNSDGSTIQQQQASSGKKKRNPPGNPDPSAEVIALSPTTLMATNRFVCEICHKGFQRDQNLQLHRRGHNLPWKLRPKTSSDIRKRVYICPEPSCVHHNPARALGDLTGIKKHYSRKHGEKKWECEKCSKKYAVQSDWKAHSKTCGTKEYQCDCGTIFSRKDSFITHRAFCDALAEENKKVANSIRSGTNTHHDQVPESTSTRTLSGELSTSILTPEFNHRSEVKMPFMTPSTELMPVSVTPLNMAGSVFSHCPSSLFGNSLRDLSFSSSCLQLCTSSSAGYNGYNDGKNSAKHEDGIAQMSATALLQKSSLLGATVSSNISPPTGPKALIASMAPWSYNGIVPQQHSSSFGDNYIQTENCRSQIVRLVEGSTAGRFAQRKTQETSAMEFHSNQDKNMKTISSLRNENLDFSHFQADSGSIFNGSPQSGPDTPTGRASANLTKYGGNSASSSSTTLDLLGVGDFRPAIFHQMQQQEMNFETVGRQRMHGFSTFQQHVDTNQVTIQKSVWGAGEL